MATANNEAQGEAGDIKKLAEDMIEDLDSAECCETHEDLIANLDSALATASSIVKQLREALADAKANGPDGES